MIQNRMYDITRHVATHTERSAEDVAAVDFLRSSLRSKGKIITNFASHDTWPNVDGDFEFVSNPSNSRIPEQKFVVQIKGTHYYTETPEGGIKYQLKSLGFPAYLATTVSLDPGILFVVLNPDEIGEERIFWKYISAEYIDTIDFSKNSTTVTFSPQEELIGSKEKINEFCKKLERVAELHKFSNPLRSRRFNRDAALRSINYCSDRVSQSISKYSADEKNRDEISGEIIAQLNELCSATLVLNALKNGGDKVSLQVAWEKALMDIRTKFLATYFQGLEYIHYQHPDEGQNERLMMKYYSFLWQTQQYLKNQFGIQIIDNLSDYPLEIDEVDLEYYRLIAKAMDEDAPGVGYTSSRYYVQKETPFFIDGKRYFEITLQLAGTYTTKFNRITVYSASDISTSYPVVMKYHEADILLWGYSKKSK